MIIYEARIRWNNDGKEEDALIAKFDTFEEEEDLYCNEKFDELFGDSGYSDDDIRWYIGFRDEIAKEPEDADFTIEHYKPVLKIGKESA